MARSPTSDEARELAASGEYVQAGRLYESAHRLEEAVDAYLRGGAYNDGARVLSHQGLFREAGETLLFYLPAEPTPVDRLTPDARRHALNAALCFARGGARREAVGLLMNLGENHKAASLLSMAGLRQEAVLAMRGTPIEGSPWPAGVVFPLRPPPPRGAASSAARPPPPARGAAPETVAPSSRISRRSVPGVSAGSRSGSYTVPVAPRRSTSPRAELLAGASIAGDPEYAAGPPLGERRLSGAPQETDATQALMALEPGDPRLPSAVQTVLAARWRQEPLSPRLLQFLDRYVEAGAAGMVSEEERPTFYAIGRLYEYHDRMGAARKSYRVAAMGAGIADAAMRLTKIDEGLVQTQDGRWLPLHMVVDGKHHQFASLPDLARLPVLGSVAPAPDDAMDFDDYMARPPTEGGAPSFSGSVPSPMPSPRSAWTADPVSRSSEDFSGMLGPIGEGSVIADRYRIDAFIGQGGMGTVYRATDMELEEVVAIKVFQQVVQNTKGLERFRREMKLSRKLIHPNVVRIYEFGTWRGARYITMELLSGLDLEEYLKSEGGTLPTAQALSLMMQCCDGLIAAHKQGVVHRDIKPQNLFVVENGKRIKIMDFGIAKVSNGTSISITGVRVGTPRYMSPEQIQGGGQVGPPADLYALGGVMYELFTGSPVFDEEELVPLLLNHMTEEPVPPSERNPGLSAEIEHIILRLLQKDPENRYRDAAELKRELLSAYVQAERLPSR